MERSLKYVWLSIDNMTEPDREHMNNLVGHYYFDDTKWAVYFLSVDLFCWMRGTKPHPSKDKSDIVVNSFTELMERVSELRLNKALGIDND